MASTDTGDDGFVPVADADAVRESGRELVRADGRSIALFYHEGEFQAVDNRCPHMGFPLTDGTVEDGVLTCHWHHARFELSCGDTFDPWADDVQSFPVEVRDGRVYVDPDPPRDESPDVHWANRLETGLQENLRLVVAKAAIGLDDAGVPPTDPLATGLRFGTHYRADGWSSGLTILVAMANVLDDLRPEDRPRALYTGLRHVASDCAGEPPKFDQPSFRVRDRSPERLTEWFRESVEVRDADGAERCLRTAVASGVSEEAVARMVFAAATDHRYLDTGHTLDFCNKAFEALDHVGWDEADDVLASLVTSLTDADRAEESAEWRQPEDLAGQLDDAFADLDGLVAAGTDADWNRPDGLLDTLLDDDHAATVAALSDAVAAGASTTQLADAVCDAAATRVARFATSNEFSDWNTVHHTFSYANAVREATRRTDATELYRGVFDAATNVYLDRFLNSPPAPLPDPGSSDSTRDPGAVLDDLEATFDTEGEVNTAGRLVGEFFDVGGDPADLKRTLGRTLLREDAGFHTLQNYEAGVRQFDRTRSERARRTAMTAIARYQAAHFPTRREAEQTYTIARRLHRGEAIHEAE